MGFKQAMTTIGGGILVASIACTSLVTAAGETPSTFNSKWAEATKEYLKFQKMNPIGLGGRRAYDPPYLVKEQ